ncbi:MAG: hypothetical protein ISN64_01760 [Rickettsia sp.]|nr:hypothetical protein [Rickettsia sp.]
MSVIKILFHIVILILTVSCSRNAIIDNPVRIDDLSTQLDERRIPLYNSRYIEKAKKNLVADQTIKTLMPLEFADIKTLYKESYLTLIEQDKKFAPNQLGNHSNIQEDNSYLIAQIYELEQKLHKLQNSKQNSQKSNTNKNIILKPKEDLVSRTPVKKSSLKSKKQTSFKPQVSQKITDSSNEQGKKSTNLKKTQPINKTEKIDKKKVDNYKKKSTSNITNSSLVASKLDSKDDNVKQNSSKFNGIQVKNSNNLAYSKFKNSPKKSNTLSVLSKSPKKFQSYNVRKKNPTLKASLKNKKIQSKYNNGQTNRKIRNFLS